MNIQYAVITLSDKGAAGQRDDTSGPTAKTMIGEALGGQCIAEVILPDEQRQIKEELILLADDTPCNLIVTTGGTGVSPRDVTPEATKAVIDREVPGMAEAMRAAGAAKTPLAMLSRGVCGLRGSTLIINLSGSPKAVREQLSALLPALPHALEKAMGSERDCAEDSG